jgi:hypothetical protein
MDALYVCSDPFSSAQQTRIVTLGLGRGRRPYVLRGKLSGPFPPRCRLC